LKWTGTVPLLAEIEFIKMGLPCRPVDYSQSHTARDARGDKANQVLK
jgi:hypothetical protein